MRKSSFLFLLVILSGQVFAFDVGDYDYKLSLTPECSEYLGYVVFEFPVEFGGLMSSTVYSDEELFVDDSGGAVIFSENGDWYVNSVPGYSVGEVEKIFDGDYSSDFVIENSGLEIVFQNPENVVVDKIVIETKDSLIGSFDVFSGGEEVDFSVVEDKFHYELILDDFIGDELEISFGFDGILKIRDVSFFEEGGNDDSVYGYFYVDDDCDRTREVYFGRFGENNFFRGPKSLPVFFDVEQRLITNPLYDNDFDDDGYENEEDNCLRVANSDQKDIDYNGKEDACDDFDGDGIMNDMDNCVKDSNRDQADGDGDGLGDACDEADDRFFESNPEILFLFVMIIVGAFGFLTYRILKK